MPRDPVRGKSLRYSIIGFVFLLIMALTWALDDSFVYASLGAAFFFFFLAYHNRQINPGRSHQRFGNKAQDDLFRDFTTAFKAQQQGWNKSVKSRNAQNTNNFALVILLFIGGIFFIIFISILFSDDAVDESVNSNPVYQKAENSRYAGDYDSAEFYYRQILASDPSDLDALNGIGIVLLNRQRYDDALAMFDEALQMDSDFEFARYNKALTLYHQHKYDKSLEEAFDLLRRTPDYYDAMSLAGELL
jgi:tetratricopeptide (TPR) repeat protein